jgi:hypothetical protein
MMTTAHNQVLAGKPINIEPIVNLDPKTHYMNAVERSNESFTVKKTAGKKDVKKTLVKSEESQLL